MHKFRVYIPHLRFMKQQCTEVSTMIYFLNSLLGIDFNRIVKKTNIFDDNKICL